MRIHPHIMVFYSPYLPKVNRIRYYKHTMTLTDYDLCFLKAQKLNYVKFVRHTSYSIRQSEPRLLRSILNLKSCRRLIREGVGKIEGYSNSKIALLFPNLQEENVCLDSYQDWKRMLRRFNIKRLNLILEDMEDLSDYNDNQQNSEKIQRHLEASIYRFKKQLHKRKCLKTIELRGLLTQKMIHALERLDTIIPLIKSLEGIKLCLFDNYVEFDEKHAQLQIFKFVKKVSYYAWGHDNILKFILSNPDSFYNLESLLIERMSLYEHSLSYLANLQNFLNLKHFQIKVIFASVYSLRSFFQNFSLPINLERLEFDISSDVWEGIQRDAQGNPFEEDPRFAAFSSTWEKLHKLTSAKFACMKALPCYPNSFVFTVIKKSKSLQSLDIVSSDFQEFSRIHQESTFNEERSIDLGTMLNLIRETKSMINSVYVLAPSISLRNLAYSEGFALNKLCLDGLIADPKSINSIFKMVKPGDMSMIELFNIKIEGKEELNRLLNQAVLPCKVPSVGIVSQITHIDKKDFLSIVTHFVSRLKIRDQCYLACHTNLEFEESELRAIGDLLERKCRVKFFLIKGTNLLLRWKKRINSYEIDPVYV